MLSKLAICVAIMSNALNSSATNAPRSRLENIYLLNVALYMPERDLVNLAMVNKKTQETLLMMRRTTIDARSIDLLLTVAQTRELRKLKALSFKEFGRQIETLDFRGNLEHCLYIARKAKDIDPKEISTIALYGRGCEIRNTCNLPKMLTSYGFTNVKHIEMHKVLGENLYSMLCDTNTFNKKPIIICEDIDVNSFKRDLDDSHAYIGESNVRVHIKSVDLSNTDYQQDQLLTKIFNNAGFYMNDVVYHEDLNDKDADYARKTIRVRRRHKDQPDWNWDNILEIASKQYEKRLRPAVYIKDQLGFDVFSIEDLKDRGLIEQDENDTITLIKWSGSLNPIAEYPISLEALIGGYYGCEYDDKHAVDITGFQPGDPNTSTAMYNADSLIIRDNGERYAIYGSYIPRFATPHQSFWDEFFDYSGSEIVISDDVEQIHLEIIPYNINGQLTFRGKRTDEEKSQICRKFTNSKKRYIDIDIDVIDVKGINAQKKIKQEDLYYSTVQINFPDFKADKVDPEHHAICEHTETECGKEQTPAGEYHSIGKKPTFRYLLKTKKLELQPFNLPIGNRTNSTRTLLLDHLNIPIFQLTGVFDDVYTAPNKRLVIHPNVGEIDFQPRAEAGLTFVLSPKLFYINKEFWQQGNSYLLNAWKDETTLNYLKFIKDQHEIDISDRPDEFGFWNISKKNPFTIN